MNKQDKSINTITLLSILVIVIAVVCSIVPLITGGEVTDKTVLSTFGNEVTLYGKGLYAMNS